MQQQVTWYKTRHTGLQKNVTRPLGNLNKEKPRFSSYLCIILEVGTFFCNPVWQILYHVTCCCKRPINESKFDRVMTFSPHKGMDLEKICLSKMVYCQQSIEQGVPLPSPRVVFYVVSAPTSVGNNESFYRRRKRVKSVNFKSLVHTSDRSGDGRIRTFYCEP